MARTSTRRPGAWAALVPRDVQQEKCTISAIISAINIRPWRVICRGAVGHNLGARGCHEWL